MPPDADPYALVTAPPPLTDYLELRRRSGLTPVTPPQGEGALSGSWYFCHVRHADDGVVAMGRIVGDGGWYFHLADMATLPQHQRRGLGARVLGALLARIDEVAPPGAYVTLMADEPGRPLYAKHGFVPTAPRSIGMRLAR
jgi:GNAT superfamily N-acetyltransferase